MANCSTRNVPASDSSSEKTDESVELIPDKARKDRDPEAGRSKPAGRSRRTWLWVAWGAVLAVVALAIALHATGRSESEADEVSKPSPSPPQGGLAQELQIVDKGKHNYETARKGFAMLWQTKSDEDGESVCTVTTDRPLLARIPGAHEAASICTVWNRQVNPVLIVWKEGHPEALSSAGLVEGTCERCAQHGSRANDASTVQLGQNVFLVLLFSFSDQDLLAMGMPNTASQAQLQEWMATLSIPVRWIVAPATFSNGLATTQASVASSPSTLTA